MCRITSECRLVLTTSPAAVLLRFEEYHPRTQSRGDHLILKRAERTAEAILRRRFARQAAAFQRGWTSHKAVINRHTQVFADLPDDVQRVVELSFDSSVTDDEALQLTAAMVRAGQAGVRAAAADADSTVDPERYRLVARQAVRWLRNHVNELFRSVDDTTKQRIGRTLAAGLRDGDHLDALSARVTRTLGEGGWRARMIAQTETMNAYSRSAEETAAGLGVQQMQWLDGQLGACPVCVSLHEAVKTLGPGAVYRGIDGVERARPPAHPACRCVQIAYYEDQGSPLDKEMENQEQRLSRITDYEESVVLDSRGRVLSITKGEEVAVDPVALPQGLQGMTVLHNHPNAPVVGLSVADVRYAADNKVAELRAVDPKGFVASIKAGSNGWPTGFEVREKFGDIRIELLDKYLPKVESGKMTQEQLRNLIAVQGLTRTAKALGLKYRVFVLKRGLNG